LLEKQGISQQAYDQVLTELSTLEAEAALLQAQLEKTLIRAPFTGQLGLRQISEGSYLSPGMPIVSLVRIQPVKLNFSVPERYAPYINNGHEVSFTVENNPGKFTASIYAIEPRIDSKTRSLPVRALYANSDKKIVPGSFARVIIPLVSKKETLQVKAEALIPEMGTHKIFVYRNGTAQAVNVITGLRTESAVEIVSGLQSGDTVITTGLLQMHPGMKVQLTAIN
jgi:membrane fusion protein (multidrug efflux system)